MDGYELPDSDEALLAECDVQTFRATGPGGQGVNTTDSAVRLRHRPTGVTVVCRRERSQHLNKTACVKRLRGKLEALAYEPPERTPTKPSRAAKQARLTEKRVVSQRKRARRRITPDEE
jgi:protein subunit release factor B